MRGLSESVKRVLSSVNVKVYFKPITTLRHTFPSPKDKPSDLQTSSVVYDIPCRDCKAHYIGQTGRRLSQRITEHKKAVQTADFNTSALAEHAWTHQHHIDWDNAGILTRSSDYISRIVHESVHIRTTSDTLNRDDGALPVEYHTLFSKC